MSHTAESVAGVLFHGALAPAGSASAAAMHGLHRLLADDGLVLEIHSWVGDGGPDGEQLYCVADLVSSRLAADQALAQRAEWIVRHGDAAIVSLTSLAGRCLRAGHEGAADWCLDAAAARRPAKPVRTSLSSVGLVGEQRRRPFIPAGLVPGTP